MTRKIKKWQWVNFAFTLLQLGCSIAVLTIVSNQLTVVTRTSGNGIMVWNYSCLMATDRYPSTCQ